MSVRKLKIGDRIQFSKEGKKKLRMSRHPIPGYSLDPQGRGIITGFGWKYGIFRLVKVKIDGDITSIILYSPFVEEECG